MKEMSVRQERVAEQIREALGQSLSKGGFKNPLIDGMISIPHVWISPDLRNARVFFTTLNDADQDMTKEVAKALNAEAFRFQQELTKFSRKSTPRLKFIPDEDTARTARIEALFNQIGVGA
ncbi:MAG: 30S ribosome-binding factor RbfA [Pseudomonadota bacterium]|nr:ribosome-binding factor A [Magnetococcales bacterium]MEC8067540.1 30S ribosome-binding factor RbfA [Pseudomonadota bacterium]MEC8467260.1 30S ribosome-binding factor RbfA [Pseudomonadota bacterium]|tara:strand:+ start:3941 stop:4303 length:363 start_codon:yes stop_codon:yes gene_type:complete